MKRKVWFSDFLILVLINFIFIFCADAEESHVNNTDSKISIENSKLGLKPLSLWSGSLEVEFKNPYPKKTKINGYDSETDLRLLRAFTDYQIGFVGGMKYIYKKRDAEERSTMDKIFMGAYLPLRFFEYEGKEFSDLQNAFRDVATTVEQSL